MANDIFSTDGIEFGKKDKGEVHSTRNEMTRAGLADHIIGKILSAKKRLRDEFSQADRIQSCYLDDVLPIDVALQIYEAFPDVAQMNFRSTIKEKKYTAVQMNQFHSIVEESIFAFQDRRIVKLISEITGIGQLEPDPLLYAGGISMMPQGSYLRPHIDNSHDKDRNRYRALNLLYYVTPNWQEDFGGNLELWDQGPKGKARVIPSLFNRLAIMITHQRSWHSVSEVTNPGKRCCVSNYYFSPRPPDKRPYFHVTSFRGRPGEVLTDAVLSAENLARAAIRKVFRKGVVNPNIYRRGDLE